MAGNPGGKNMSGRVKLAILAAFSIVCANGATAEPQKIGAPPEATNMRLVGMNDLQARSAYQPTIHKQGDRYIAYIGHHGGTAAGAEADQSADRPGRVQRHLDRRRHRSGAARNTCFTFPARRATTRPAARR